MPAELIIEGVQISVVRKRIKHVRITVYPPAGRVLVAIPLATPDAVLRRAVAGRLDWIRRQQARIALRPRTPVLEYVSGETHDYLGESYALDVVERPRRDSAVELDGRTMRLYVKTSSSAAGRRQALLAWYRRQLKSVVPPLLDKWQAVTGVSASEWRVKHMKTRWGTCNIKARRIWLNLELARGPAQQLEFIIVHELVHLLERHHNSRFRSLMDRFMPEWRVYDDELKRRGRVVDRGA